MVNTLNTKTHSSKEMAEFSFENEDVKSICYCKQGTKSKLPLSWECVEMKLCKPCTSFTSYLHNSCGMMWYRTSRVNVPTHHHDHTLDWPITNCTTDVFDLTIDNMLLSDHIVFVVFYTCWEETLAESQRKAMSNNIISINLYVLVQMLTMSLSLPLSAIQLTPSVSTTHVCTSYLTTIPLLLHAQWPILHPSLDGTGSHTGTAVSSRTKMV